MAIIMRPKMIIKGFFIVPLLESNLMPDEASFCYPSEHIYSNRKFDRVQI
jgi:hypothetical protein